MAANQGDMSRQMREGLMFNALSAKIRGGLKFTEDSHDPPAEAATCDSAVPVPRPLERPNLFGNAGPSSVSTSPVRGLPVVDEEEESAWPSEKYPKHDDDELSRQTSDPMQSEAALHDLSSDAPSLASQHPSPAMVSIQRSSSSSCPPDATSTTSKISVGELMSFRSLPGSRSLQLPGRTNYLSTRAAASLDDSERLCRLEPRQFFSAPLLSPPPGLEGSEIAYQPYEFDSPRQTVPEVTDDPQAQNMASVTPKKKKNPAAFASEPCRSIDLSAMQAMLSSEPGLSEASKKLLSPEVAAVSVAVAPAKKRGMAVSPVAALTMALAGAVRKKKATPSADLASGYVDTAPAGTESILRAQMLASGEDAESKGNSSAGRSFPSDPTTAATDTETDTELGACRASLSGAQESRVSVRDGQEQAIPVQSQYHGQDSRVVVDNHCRSQDALQQGSPSLTEVTQTLQQMPFMPDGSEFPSEGSMGHFEQACKPCLFWYNGPCLKAQHCPFCHVPHSMDEIRRMRPSKATRNLLKRNREKHLSDPAQNQGVAGYSVGQVLQG